MSSDLSTMSADLATMASSLAAMSSTLASMALTNPASTASSPAQSKGSKPTSIEKAYILIYGEDTLDSQGGKVPAKETTYTINSIAGIFLSREMGKNTARDIVTEQVDRRLNDFGLTDDGRHALDKGGWLIPETDDGSIWETGWINQDDSLGESSATGDTQTYAHLQLVEISVEDASVKVSGGDGKSKDEDTSERGSNRSVGEEG